MSEPIPPSDASVAAATEPKIRRVGGLKRVLFVGLAGFFFVLGALGAFLPGLPATPFLLLTSFFLVRTSPRLNNALLRSRLFGPILVDWQVHGGVRRDIKVKAVVVVSLVVALSIYLAGYSLGPTIAILMLAGVGILVVVLLPEAKRP